MSFSVASAYKKLQAVVENASSDVLPHPDIIATATKAIVTSLPKNGRGEAATEQHLLNDLIPGFQGQKTSSNYYGFVTGGVLPIAEVADNVVTAYDQNTMVHLPDQSINTTVEDAALTMLIELLDLGDGWNGRTFTTGATASNVLGLACGRESIINARLRAAGVDGGVGELGLLKACAKAGVTEIQVLTTLGHSTLYKAAGIVGIGRASGKELPLNEEEPWKLDLGILEKELKRVNEGVVSIVSISAGEINTGRFATDGYEAMKKIRELCDKYGSWLHVDGAFGLFARTLPDTQEFQYLHEHVAGLELTDSITGDCHKMLNVPYDCGFFLTRSATILPAVFQNPNASYLSFGVSNIPSPLNIGIENSRRFRALPVYSVLVAYGTDGFSEIFTHQTRLARAVAKFLDESDDFELLPRKDRSSDGHNYGDIHISCLFRAKDETINAALGKKINDTRKIYVSGTKWEGRPASRIAISTWKVDVEKDIKIIVDVLKSIIT